MKYDLAVPTVTSNPNPGTQATIQPPPQDDETVFAIAQILATVPSPKKAVAALTALLVGTGITAAALTMALGMANKGTAHTPNSRLGGMAPGAPTEAARAQELYYRAAYLLNASRRIQTGLNKKQPVKVALTQEETFYRQHEAARRNRLESATKVLAASRAFGPLLGWYVNPLLQNEIECLTANGHNFYAEQGTLIGYPGSVHPHCGCQAGPPIPGGGLVNDALSKIITVKSRPYKLKVKGKKSA